MSLKAHVDYARPPSGQAVSRFDHCPCFAERKSILAADPICWFCKFAAFDLFSDRLPECGICRHPDEQPAPGACQPEKKLSERCERT